MFFLYVSCQTETFEYPAPVPAYPTKLPVLSSQQLNEKMALLSQMKDSVDIVTMDQFGFLSIRHTFTDTMLINAKSIKKIAYGRLERYAGFLGMENLSQALFQNMFYFRMLSTGGGLSASQNDELIGRTLHLLYPPGNAKIRAYMPQGYFQEYPIEATSIDFYLDEKSHQITISGFWKQQIYIPPSNVVSAGNAVTIALNDLIHYENGVPESFSVDDILKHAIKVIRPVVKDNEYQFRVCWKLTIGNYFIQYYIDTQTGEIVLKYYYSLYI